MASLLKIFGGRLLNFSEKFIVKSEVKNEAIVEK